MGTFIVLNSPNLKRVSPNNTENGTVIIMNSLTKKKAQVLVINNLYTCIIPAISDTSCEEKKTKPIHFMLMQQNVIFLVSSEP